MQNFTKDVYMLIVWLCISLSFPHSLSRSFSLSICECVCVWKSEFHTTERRSRVDRNENHKRKRKRPAMKLKFICIYLCVCVVKYTSSKNYDKNALPTDMGILVLTQAKHGFEKWQTKHTMAEREQKATTNHNKNYI